MIGLGIIAIAAGIVLAWAALAGWRGQLSRDRPVGVRTPSTMRSDEAFAAAPGRFTGLSGSAGR